MDSHHFYTHRTEFGGGPFLDEIDHGRQASQDLGKGRDMETAYVSHQHPDRLGHHWQHHCWRGHRIFYAGGKLHRVCCT